MSVSNYTPNKCRYLISQLEEVVYLVSEEALKDIKIDNGSAYVASITNDTPLSIKCYNIKLTDDEVLDERYRFTHTVTFSVRGYMNKDNFNEKYYVILKDKEGTYWLINPLFPSKVTYTYTLGENQNHTDFTLATASNHPVLRLMEFSVTDANECDSYFYDGIDELRLNEKKYSAHIENHVKYTNGGFKDVVFNEKTCTLTETFDGNKVSHQIDFNILLSQYKNDWHYSLLEFKDNLYAAVIKTLNGKYALCGFSFGMQPSFTINGESQTTSDHIKITLTDAHDDGDPLQFYDSVDYEYLSARTWKFTADYGGYECVGEGVARYLLKTEVDALENETGNFQVFEGYESYFPELHIVGEFNRSESFSNIECKSNDCTITTSLPGTLEFNSVECQTYYVKSDTNWSIESSKSHITVSPASGLANVAYTINVCNTLTPTSSAETSTLTLNYCNTSSTVNITVIEDENACLPQGAVYNISANEQTLTIPTRCCVESVRETVGAGSVSSIYSTYIQTLVPANNTGSNRQFVLLVIYCDGTSGNIIINQSNTFEEWRLYGTMCVNGDKVSREYKWTGITSSNYVETDEFRDNVIEYDSYDCYYTDEWAYRKYILVDNDWFCDDGNKYGLLRMYVSMDNINWRATEIYKKGELIEEHSIDCCWDSKWDNYQYTKYEEILGEWICNDGNKYQKLLRYFSLDNLNWESSICIYKMGDLIEGKSTDCGYIIEPGNIYRWVATENTICVGYQEPVSGNYLTIVSNARSIITFSKNGLSYSKNKGAWETLGTGAVLLEENDKLFLKGELTPTSGGIGTFSASTGNFSVEGDIMSLLYGDNFIGQTSLSGKSYVFDNLFANCTGLTSAEDLTLPATTLANSCYNSMFYGCTNLTAAPELPATTLAESCYDGMFRNCTSLTTAPVLPSTTLANYCYVEMFAGCTSLTTTPELPATTLPRYCYYGMFKGCTSLTTVLELPATTLATNCYTEMFKGCTSLTSVPINLLRATTITGIDCYAWMFEGCTSLTTAPELPATTLSAQCYAGMFKGCTSLTTTPVLSATTLATNCYQYMFQGCTSLINVPYNLLPATTLTEQCYMEMFAGCTSLTEAPDLLAPILTRLCYGQMFDGCKKLNYIKCLATDISATHCTQSWLYGVASSGTFVKAAGMSNWRNDESGIPQNWTVQEV